jgi:hypothetical protein
MPSSSLTLAFLKIGLPLPFASFLIAGSFLTQLTFVEVGAEGTGLYDNAADLFSQAYTKYNVSVFFAS